jgi:hypothetical protein
VRVAKYRGYIVRCRLLGFSKFLPERNQIPVSRNELISVFWYVDQSVTVDRVNAEGSVEMTVYPTDVYDDADAVVLRLINEDQSVDV